MKFYNNQLMIFFFSRNYNKNISRYDLKNEMPGELISSYATVLSLKSQVLILLVHT